MDQSLPTEQRKGRFHLPALSWAEWLVLLLTALVLAIMVRGALIQLDRQGKARVALANAKASWLATRVISTEAYATGSRFSDFTAADGFSAGVARNIGELSKCPGTVRLLQTDKTGYQVAALLYTEGDFAVTYTASDSSWIVTWHDKRLDYAAEA